MSLSLGNTTIGSIYLGSTKIGEAYLGSTKVYGAAAPVDPYNPLGLPAMTMRVKLAAGKDPSGAYWNRQTSLVDATENIWDITVESFANLGFGLQSVSPIEILGANTSGVTSFAQTFRACSTLTSVGLFDTSSATDMSLMFNNCSSLTALPLFPTGSVTTMEGICKYCRALTAVPLFDTSSVANMYQAFTNCSNVEHGALALYQQASSQAVPPENHSGTFSNCGGNTITGQAELAQIPSDWK